MVDTQNTVITEMIFKSNVEALRNINKQMTYLGKTVNSSGAEMKKAFQMSSAQINLNKNIKLSEDLMKKTGLEANALSQGLRQMGLQLKGGKIFDNFGKELQMADINMNKLRKSAWRFNMNILTIMFGFMALQRIVTNFGRSAITTYQKANEDTQGLGKSTWQLQAAWEFLKYSLVDALTQSPLFQMFVQWLIQIVQWFNKLTPAQKSWIAIGIAIIFVIATVSVLYSTLQPLISLLTAGGIVSAIKNVAMLAGRFLMWAAIIYFVWQIITGLFTGWNKGSKNAEKSSISLSKVIGFLAQTFVFLGKLVNLGAQVIGMALANMKDGFIILAKSVQLSFAMTFNAVISNFERMINTIINGINAAIRGLQRLGVRISTIPTFKTGLQIDTSTISNEIATLQKQIKDRTLALVMDTPTISELWRSSDLSNMFTQGTTSTVANTNNLEIGSININGAGNNVMNNVDTLTEEISNKVLEQITDQLNRKNDSNTN